MLSSYPSNLHTHTHYSDGTNPFEDYLRYAIERGLKSYAFTDHAPIPIIDCNWCMDAKALNSYKHEIEALKIKYNNQIEILSGLEVDYIPDIISPLDYKNHNFDIVVGSIHYLKLPHNKYLMKLDSKLEHFKEGLEYLFKNDYRKAIDYFFKITAEMINIGGFDIAGHVDKVKMYIGLLFPKALHTDWYLEHEYNTARLLVESGVFVEINTRGIYKGLSDAPYPSWNMIKQISDMGGKLILNADTHDPQGVIGFYNEVLNTLKSKKIPFIFTRQNRQWIKYYL
jgi:histidinol-phosphatase (PHP family)